MNSFEDLLEKLNRHYQAKYRFMLLKESKNLKTPTAGQFEEIVELRGYLKGVMYATNLVAIKQTHDELPLGSSAGGE